MFFEVIVILSSVIKVISADAIGLNILQDNPVVLYGNSITLSCISQDSTAKVDWYVSQAFSDSFQNVARDNFPGGSNIRLINATSDEDQKFLPLMCYSVHANGQINNKTLIVTLLNSQGITTTAQPPESLVILPKNLVVERGGNITLQCYVSSNDPVTTLVSWFVPYVKNGFSHHTLLPYRGGMNMTLVNVTSNDTITFICAYKNLNKIVTLTVIEPENVIYATSFQSTTMYNVFSKVSSQSNPAEVAFNSILVTLLIIVVAVLILACIIIIVLVICFFTLSRKFKQYKLQNVSSQRQYYSVPLFEQTTSVPSTKQNGDSKPKSSSSFGLNEVGYEDINESPDYMDLEKTDPNSVDVYAESDLKPNQNTEDLKTTESNLNKMEGEGQETDNLFNNATYDQVICSR